MANLKLKDDQGVLAFDITGSGINIGRDRKNDIVLHDESVSGFHAIISFENGRFEILDLGSTNGTWRNDMSVKDRVRLIEGDLLRFGNTVLEVLDMDGRDGAPAYSPRPSAPEQSSTFLAKEKGLLAVLVSCGGKQGPARFEIRSNITIGRMSDNDIVLDTPMVSAIHARIIAEKDRLEVFDLGSANGTWVNGQRIRQQLLHHGDRLRFDTIEYIVERPSPLTGNRPVSKPAIIDASHEFLAIPKNAPTGGRETPGATGPGSYPIPEKANTAAPSDKPLDPLRFGGFWMRAAAYCNDLIILIIIISIASFIVQVMNIVSGGGAIIFSENANSLRGIVISWLYSALLHSSKWQATIGKKLLGLKVVDENGNRISFGRATGRHFAEFLSAFILFVGYLMVIWSKKKQGLHDIIAGTCVVKTERKTSGFKQTGTKR